MLNCAKEVVMKWEDNKPFMRLTAEEVEILCVSLIKATHTMHKISNAADINAAKKEAEKFLDDWPFGKENYES